MEPFDWMAALTSRCREDPWVQECLEAVNALTPQYLAIFHSLPPRQQEILDCYIVACEELEYSKTLLAYRLGQEHPADDS